MHRVPGLVEGKSNSQFPELNIGTCGLGWSQNLAQQPMVMSGCQYFWLLVPETWRGIISAGGLVTEGQLGQRLSQRKWSSPCHNDMVMLLDPFS